MIPAFMPQLWAVIAAILGTAGVVWEPSSQVKSAVGVIAGVVVAVVQWQHHRTLRHAETIAGQVAAAKVNAQAAGAASDLETLRQRVTAHETTITAMIHGKADKGTCAGTQPHPHPHPEPPPVAGPPRVLYQAPDEPAPAPVE